MSVPENGFDPQRMQGQYAGFITRLVAFIIDIVILSVIYTMIGLTVQAIGSFFQQDLFEMAREDAFVGTLASAAAAIFPVFYYTFFWALTGQSPGKAFMGIRIYTVDGSQLSVRRAFVRYLTYWLSAGLVFAGFLLVLVDDRRQTLHDKISKTVVVYVWEARMHRLVVQRARRGIASRE